MGNFKPLDLYLGIVELFAVLLPGSLLVTAAVWELSGEVTKLPVFLQSGPGAWVGGGLTAYALGTFAFILAAGIDELVYDPWREARWPKGSDMAYREATRLRRAALGEPTEKGNQPPPDTLPSLGGRIAIFGRELGRSLLSRLGVRSGKASKDLMNTFSWAKSVLIISAPGAYADIQRYEAESKFFRSLILVAPVIGGVAHHQGVGWAGWAAAAAVVMSFLRYAEQRYKGTEWAFRYVIVHQAIGRAATPEPKP